MVQNPKPVKLSGDDASYKRYVNHPDWIDYGGDHSRTLNTQSEVDLAIRRVFFSNHPQAQIDFYQRFLPKLDRAGWRVPAYYRQALARQTEIYYLWRERFWQNEPGIRVEVAVPYQLNMEELVREYSPGWNIVTSENENVIILKDENNDVVLQIMRDSSGVYKSIASPLSPIEIEHAILWMPTYIHADFVALLGFAPTYQGLTVAGVKTYVQERIRREEGNIGPLDDMAVRDPLCLRNISSIISGVLFEKSLKKPNTIREAVMTQCSTEPEIRYPAFGIVTADSSEPSLYTHEQATCIVIAIHDKKTTKTLLAHFPTTDTARRDKYLLEKDLNLACQFPSTFKMSSCSFAGIDTADALGIGFNSERHGFSRGLCCMNNTFPIDWYVSVFRNVYFNNSDE